MARFPDDLETVRATFARPRFAVQDRSEESTDPDGERSLAETEPIASQADSQVVAPTSNDKHPERIGRYKILGVLGQGGFGTVYRARDDELERDVAIKVWRPDRFPAGADIENLMKEARTVARLEKHPSIVGVYDVGRRDDGSPFVVLEFVEGQSLRQELRSTGKKLPTERIWEIIIQITSAIQHAHATGLVHRDLKPANILLDAAGNALVTDFGLAVDEESQRHRAGELSGTAAYMAPEQVRGETHRLDGRADIWALGVILYEMLAGRPPFPGDTRDEIFDEILHREPKPPRQLDPEIDQGLEQICLKCLSKSITERYLTAADLAKHLYRVHPERRLARKRRVIATAIWIGAALLALFGVAWAYVAFRSHQPQITINPGAGIHVHLRSTLVGHGGEVWSVAFSPDDKTLASAGVDKVIKLWDVESSQPRAELTGHLAEVCDVAFSPDGRTLASGGNDRIIKLWDVASGKPRREITDHTGGVRSVAFAPDGQRLISGSLDKTIRFWDPQSGHEQLLISVHQAAIQSVTCSPDGQTVASASDDQTVKLHNAKTGQNVLTLVGHTDGVCDVAFSPDGKKLASVSWDKTIRIWEVATGNPLLEIKGHRDAVRSVAFSPDGKRLATGSDDNTIKLWDAETGRELATLRAHTGPVTAVTFSSDGRILASASGDKTVKLWELAVDKEKKPEAGRKTAASAIEKPKDKPVEPAPPKAGKSPETTGPMIDKPSKPESPSPKPVGPAETPAQAPPPAIAPFTGEEAKQHQERWAEYLGVPVEVTNSIGMELVLIPPGEFEMGVSEREMDEWTDEKTLATMEPRERQFYRGTIRRSYPKWRAKITKPFYLGKHEVTQEEYERVVGHNPSCFAGTGKRKADVAGQDTSRFPVEDIYQNVAREFCTTLSALTDEQSAGRVYRLPRDAEWEYGCRAGATTRYCFGQDKASLGDYAWFMGNSAGQPHPVGGKKANTWGLHDMHGNVWECCDDEWRRLRRTYFSYVEGSIVNRGGAWSSDAKCVECWLHNTRRHAAELVGFRVACPIDTVPEEQTVELIDEAYPTVTVEVGPKRKVEPIRIEIPPDPEVSGAEPGEALSSMALVTAPATFPGVQSWTLETAGHRGPVNCVAYSPGSRVLATACDDGVVRVWDLEDGHCKKALLGHQGEVRSVTWSPDGKYLASGAKDNTIRFWDPQSGRLLRTIDGHTAEVTAVAWSPHGQTLASIGDDSAIRVWDVTSGEAARVLEAHTDRINAVAWSPNGEMLASSSRDKTIRLWLARSGESERTIATVCVTDIAWSPDGKLLAAAQHHPSRPGVSAILLDVVTRGLPVDLLTLNDGVRRLAWSPDGEMLVTSGEFMTWNVQGWDFDTKAEGMQVPPPLPGRREATALAFSPDGRSLAAAGVDGVVQIADSVSGESRHTLPAHLGIFGAVFSNDGKMLASSGDAGTVRVWDFRSGHVVGEQRHGGVSIRGLSWAPDGNSLARGAFPWDTAWVWDFRADRRITIGTDSIVSTTAWSPDGKTLAIGASGKAFLVDPTTGERIHEFPGGSARVAWSTEGKRLAVSQGNKIRICDTQSGEILLVLDNPGRVGRLKWSWDDKMLAVGTDNASVCLWDAKSGQLLSELRGGHKEKSHVDVQWMQDGKTLFSSTRTECCAWDTATGKLLWKRPRQGSSVLSPDDRFIACPGASFVRFRNAEDDQLLWTTLQLQDKQAAVLSPDGHWRASPGTEKEALRNEFVYVVLTDDGRQLTLTPDEFEQQYGWKNDPAKVSSEPASSTE
ncbi:MAG: protein kinase [Planctomycetes bacterium]|nr:protein kinase [Planctomycetota bacterium]